jgi:hypothetical protein
VRRRARRRGEEEGRRGGAKRMNCPHNFRILHCVLGGLANDTEVVCEVAMCTGQTIVNEYYATAVDVLIPSLKEGMLTVFETSSMLFVVLKNEIKFVL